jgi:hypothetical protein
MRRSVLEPVPRFAAATAPHVHLSLVLALVLLDGTARAAEFYVDPAAGSASGDGSMSQPWQTLEGVAQAGQFGKAIHAGDTVWLHSGYHGAFVVSGGTYTPAITVAAATGQTPRVSRVSFSQTHGWVASGLSISPSHAPSPVAGGTMVQVDKSSTDVVVKNCDLFSIPDASGWGATEWINTASSAVQVSGDRVTISNNRATNVRFGISVDGPNALIEYNQIVNFSADGLRGLGDFGVFQYNVVKNVYVDDAAGDTNHDDGFQSWSVGTGGVGTGVVTGVVLRGNYFLNREDPNQKLTNAMQGIGCFDGLFDGWVVENNVVATDHWHGISFYGMKNSRIVNNTVIDVNNVSPGPPWIMVTPHKDGRASENVLIRNNLATDYDLTGNAIVQDHNTTLTNNLAAFFADPGKFDLHLLKSAPAVDTGSADQAPPLDADRIPRPQGQGVDLGAYEWLRRRRWFGWRRDWRCCRYGCRRHRHGRYGCRRFGCRRFGRSGRRQHWRLEWYRRLQRSWRRDGRGRCRRDRHFRILERLRLRHRSRALGAEGVALDGSAYWAQSKTSPFSIGTLTETAA